MREVEAGAITGAIREMCIEANLELSLDMKTRLSGARKSETSELGRQILDQLDKNMQIAKEDQIPICQDTGMTTVFVEIGQEVHILGNLTDAINQGIREGYEQGYLRKSVVGDPLERVNTKDNTPGIIHYDIVSGEGIRITVAPKGFGSENMSRVCMLKPADGKQGVMDAVIETVKLAGPNACPPLVVGVGIGGNFEKCTWLAKKALTRNCLESSKLPHIAQMEEALLSQINELSIGPAGLGGSTTALAVNIETYPTHIAGLPVAINICCHVNRHVTREI